MPSPRRIPGKSIPMPCGSNFTQFRGKQAWTTALFFQISSSEELSVDQWDDLVELFWGAAPLKVLQAT